MSLLKLILFGAAIAVSGSVSAQYTGPGADGKQYTVAEVKENAAQLDKSDAIVKLEGFIVERINKEDFWFEDESGRVMLEIDKKDMPERPFNDQTKLIIIGEVDYDVLEEVEIEVEEIHFTD